MPINWCKTKDSTISKTPVRATFDTMIGLMQGM